MIYKIKIFFLLLFVFSLPFEYWDPYGIAHFFTVTKFTALLYFIVSLSDAKTNFTLKYLKKPVLLLFSLWLFMLVVSIFNYWPGSNLSIYNFTFFQNIVLFWLIANDLIKNRSLLQNILLTLIISVFIMASLTSFGIGLDTEIDPELESIRLSFFGSNPNTVGNLASISLLFVIGMAMNKKRYFGNKTLFLLFTIPSLISVLSLSGSRGALIISLVGIIILFLFRKGSLVKKISFLVLGTILIFRGLDSVLESQIMRNRILLTTSEGSLGGREDIWKKALDIFYDNPLFGVGVTGYQYEIIQRYGTYMDTHNIFLYFMVTGGIIALLLYLLFLKGAIIAVINYYRIKNDIFLLSIFFVYIFSVFKSGGAINNKLNWILIAIVFGVYLSADLKKNNKLLI